MFAAIHALAARILCKQRRFSDFMCNTPAGRRRCGASICKNAPPEIVNNNLIVHSFKIIYIYVQCTAALCCTTSIASAYSKVYRLATSTHAPELFTSLIALMCALVCPGLSGLRCFAACSSFRVWHALQPHTSEHACSVCVFSKCSAAIIYCEPTYRSWTVFAHALGPSWAPCAFGLCGRTLL